MNTLEKLLLWAVGITALTFFIVAISSPRPEKVYTKTYTKQFEVLEINRPKHFRVTVLDLANHELFENVGTSKHCNSWDDTGKPRVHSVVTATVHSYYTTDDESKTLYYEIDNDRLNALWCD